MEEKIFFLPGDLVTLRQDIPSKPVMLVIKKVTRIYKTDVPYLQGIQCR